MSRANKKIKFKNFLILISITLAILTMASSLLILYATAIKYAKGLADDINRSEFDYTISAIKRDYNNLFNIANNIRNNNKLKALIKSLKADNHDPYTQMLDNKYINDILSDLKQSSNHIESISIISGDQRYYTNDYLISYDLAEKLKYEIIGGVKFYHSKNNSEISPIPFGNYLIDSLDGIAHLKFVLEDDTFTYGNVYILLSSSFFPKMVEEKKNLLIYDKEGNTLYNSITRPLEKLKSTDAPGIVDEISRSGKVSVYQQKMDNGWTVSYITENTVFSDTKDKVYAMLLLSIAAGSLCAVLLSSWLSKSILHPVINLTDLLKSYTYGNEEYSQYNANTAKRRLSLRSKIFYYLIATTLIPVLLFIVLFYTQSMYWIKGQILHQYETTFERTTRYVNNYIYDKSTEFQNLLYNVAVQKYLLDSDPSQRDEALFKDTLSDFKYLGLEDNEVSFWDKNFRLIFNNYVNGTKVMDNKIIDIYNDLKQGVYWTYSRDELNRDKLVLCANVSAIWVTAPAYEHVHARLNLPLSDLQGNFGNLKTNASKVFISDYLGQNITSEFSEALFAQPQQGISGNIEYASNGEKARVFYQRIDKTPWLLIAKYDYSDITEQGFNILANNIYIIIIIGLMLIPIAYFISLILLKPINIFNGIMENYKLDDVSADSMADSFIHEIDILGISFNKMIERIEDLFDSLLIANREKNQLRFQIKAAEMVALQAQINPHFLYNTLNNLIYLIDNGHKEKAHRVVASLVKLFRFGISRGDRVIAISEEIAYAKAYADIIAIRYDNAITFNWEISEELLEYRTLKLILQPLMENSVFHGFKNRVSSCVLWIKCYKSDGDIKFTVTDNGMGIEPQELEEIRKGLASENIEDRVGIYNVQARIRLQYGRQYGVQINSVPEKGTTVTITIPEDMDGIERL